MGGGSATVYITIEVKNREELSSAMSKLLSIRSVREVRRQGN
jgi:(p)ppGpp synthase/HD superfamily hydrolase